jgi:hypothetical protein
VFEGVRVGSGGIIFNDAGVDYDFRVESDNLADALFVQGSDGNVGIGTSVPANDLQVGSIGSTGYGNNHIAFGDGTDAAAFWQGDVATQFYTSNAWRFHVNGTTHAMTIDAGGNVGIGADSPNAELEVRGGSGAGMRFSVDGQTYYHVVRSNGDGLYLGADDGNTGGTGADIRFNVEGSEHMRIKAGGNVGIGTTDPQAGLHVESSTGVRFDGVEAGAISLYLYADQGDDNVDKRVISVYDGGGMSFEGYGTGAWVKHMTIDSDGKVGIINRNDSLVDIIITLIGIQV